MALSPAATNLSSPEAVAEAAALPASRRRRLALLWAAVTLWTLVDLVWASLPAGSPESPLRARRVDLNRARIPELMTLPGVGRQRARALVLHRVRHGPFRNWDDIARVDRIGSSTVDRWRPFLIDPTGPPGCADDNAVRGR